MDARGLSPRFSHVGLLRQCGRAARAVISRPTTPRPQSSGYGSTYSTTALSVRGALSSRMSTPSMDVVRSCSSRTAKQTSGGGRKGSVNCACARHPWPEEKVEVKAIKVKPKDCDFDFRKLEVNPYDIPCDCKDPPPAAGCADVGRPKEVCCRSTRQYGCFCEEEEEESCEEESEEEVEVTKTCDLDFRKLEVNPYDDPCECHDPPPATSCESLANRKNVCCRTPRPFGCDCDAYNEPGLECFKQKAPPQKKEKKECDKKKYGTKCL